MIKTIRHFLVFFLTIETGPKQAIFLINFKFCQEIEEIKEDFSRIARKTQQIYGIFFELKDRLRFEGHLLFCLEECSIAKRWA